MAKQSLRIDTFDGVSTLFSSDKLPVPIAQKLVNMRPAHKLGRLVKRLPYSNQLTSGLTSLKRMKEFINKNAETLLMIMDGNTLEESVYTTSYAAISAITNDERTAGSTIDGDNFNPIIVNKELRAGAGITVATQRPVWYGYIAAKNRFNSGAAIAAGRYLDEQYYTKSEYEAILQEFNTEFPGYVTGGGLENQKYAVYLAPVLDGYQRTIPYLAGIIEVSATDVFRILLRIATTNEEKLKRLTAVDIFVATQVFTYQENLDAVPAYFLERVDLNSDGKYFLEITGDVGVTVANKIVIDAYADWLMFAPTWLTIYNVTDNDYYTVTGYTLDSPGAGQIALDVTPNAAADGASTLRFFSRWYESGSYHNYITHYDNYYKKLGSEMFEYLNIPTGDTGLDDFRYKYSAYNGNRLMIGGMPTDTNFTYYSANEAPDVIPALNIFRHRDDVVGLADVSQNFLVFTKRGIERIAIFGNAQSQQDDNYHDAKLVSHKAIAKVNDDMIVFCAYDSFYAVTGRQVVNIGEHLREWFEEKLTKAQKEACVAGFNDLHNEVWFSFPTYTDSYYTAGVVIVFDLEGYNKELASPWWFIKTDVAITCLEANMQYHLLGGAATKIVDFDGNGTETPDTVYRIKMLKGFLPGKKVRWNEVFVDSITSDSVTCNLYFDGSATPVALALNTDLKGMIRYLKETLEIELTTSASINTVEHSSVLLTFGHKRV